MQKTHLNIAGLMSGTSLDGLDIAVCQFERENNHWTYQIIAAETIPYSDSFRALLTNAMTFSGEELTAFDRSFGKFQGEAVAAFAKKYKLKIDLVSAHGHTIFHNPQKEYTLQIGNGASIYAACGIPVVTDFRSLDVALGGQGAPLVPLGDELLFSEYAACLNLGGIANISFIKDNKNIAFDICPVNIILNYLSGRVGKAYDNGGALASQGTCISDLYEELNKLDFYTAIGPKSLGREWVDTVIFQIIKRYDHYTIQDLLNTCVTHMTHQISIAINAIPELTDERRVLITGGGAYNTFLIQEIRKYLLKNIQIIIPDENTVQYKEAIIFAFLGLLRVLNNTNTKNSVTGASRSSVSGALYGDFSSFYEDV
jgi:anhydro-N-acetylmuramic acid kinase